MVQVVNSGPAVRFQTLNAALTALRGQHGQGVVVVRSSRDETFLSYADLYADACCALANLRRRGVGPGDALIIQVDDVREFLVLFWACLLGGIVAVPLSTGVQEQQKSKVLNVAATLRNPYWAGTDEGLERIGKVAREGDADAEATFAGLEGRALRLADVFVPGEPAVPIDVAPGRTAYIQFSSGSTGTPKGVVLTHGNLVANTCSIIERTGIGADDALLSWMPLTHDMGLICFHLSGLVAGASQYIMPTALFIRTPLLWLEKASEHRVNYLYSPNFGLQYTLSAFEGHPAPAWDLSAVKGIYNGAEPISADLCRRFMDTMQPYGLASRAMLPGYGLAEASVAVTLPDPGEPLVSHVVRRRSLRLGQPVEPMPDAAHPEAVTLVEVGFAIPRTQIRIAGPDDEPLPEGVVGHLQIRGENVTAGYHNNPQATRQAFTADGWLRTGDLGYCRNGRLVVTGRLKELIIVNGQNYYPHDLERVAQQVSGVEPGKVVATSCWNAARNREEVLLFVLFKKPAEQFVPLAKALITGLLREVGIAVDKVLPCRRILKTTSGKIQRFQFTEAYHGGEFDAAWQTIQAHLAADARAELADLDFAGKVRVCWHEATGLPFHELGSLYEMGIKSLQITQFVARLNHVAGTRLTVRDVLGCTTLGDLARMAGRREGVEPVHIPAAGPREHYPVTDAQRRLWFTDQYTGGTSAYNIAVGYAFEGALDETRLAEAFAALVARHDVLRAAFLEVEGEVRQRVRPADAPGFALAVTDATGLTNAGLEALLRDEANHRFNLREGRLIRATLYRQPGNAYTLLLVMHHAIADGWSVGVLMRDLNELYRQPGTNHPALPPLSIQYQDYAAWLAGQPQSPESLAYWQQQLEPHPSVLNFPAYAPRTPVRSRRGQTVTHAFSDEALAAIHTLARGHQATAFMVLLAMTKATLYRYTGQTDLVVGTDVANRQLDQVATQVGYFLNTLCVRTAFAAHTTLGGLIADVKRRFLAGLDHQDVSFETLLEAVRVPKDRSRSPLFDALLVFQNFEPVPFAPTADLRHVGYRYPAPDETIVDLHLELTERGGELSAQLRYNGDLYQGRQMGQFCQHLEETILAACRDAGQPLWQYALSTAGPAEGATPRLTEGREPTITEALRHSVALHRHRVAIRDGETTWTYGQLWNRANDIALQLVQHGLRAEECVGVLVPRSAEAVAAVLGILKAGGAYVPLDPEYPADRLRRVAADAGLRMVVSAGAGVAARYGLAVDHEIGADGQTPDAPEVNVVRRGRDLAYVLYTSGTTGTPKGVEIEHHALADYVRTFTDCFGIEINDEVVHQASLSFDTSVEEIFPVLLQGGSLRVVRGGGKDVEGIIAAINDGATVLSTTPLVLNEINGEADRLAGHLRLVISGGDVLRYDQVSHLASRCRVVNSYGPTETTVCACYEEITAGGSPVRIGRPIANRCVAVVGADGQQQPAGVPGELWIGGTGVARGYHNNPELTRQRFVDGPGGRYYRSGDWVRQREDGRLEFLGRRDNQVKIRGYRVETEEIEQAIGRCAGVEAVAVVVHGEGSDKQLAAYYAGRVAERELRTALAGTLPHYMLPAHLARLDVLPRTVSGKVDKTALAQLPLAPASAPSHRELTELERTVAGVWADVLGVAAVQLHDDFFVLGGHSIKGVRALHRLGQELHVTVELAELFAHPTLEAFAACVAPKRREAYAAIRSVAPQASYPASPAQRGMWLLQQVNPDSPAYNIAFAVELCGPLVAPAFERAWQRVVERHESLRTILREEAGGIGQVILAPDEAGFAVAWTDLAHAGDEAVRRRAQTLAATPFDLSAAPPLRVHVFTTGPTRRILTVVMHHAAGDDWSVDVLLREVFAHYHQLSENPSSENQPAAAPLPVQYKDYAAWQEAQLDTDAMRAHRRYWQAQLDGELPVLQLPADGDRPAVKGHAGAAATLTLDASLTEAIGRLAKTHGLSEYMVWMAALRLLLFRYTGQRDVIVGGPVAGRDHPDLEGQIGCYVNTLPLRLQLEAGWSVAELLGATRQATLAAYEHQAYPLAELAAELTLQRDASRSLLFDVLLTLQNATGTAAQPIRRDLSAAPFALPAASCKFDWDIDIRPRGDERVITVAYDTQLYGGPRMERMLGHLVGFVRAFCKDAAAPIATLDLITPAEKAHVLALSAGQPGRAVADQTIVDLLKEPFAAYADRPAIEDGQTRWTYRELGEWSNRLANKLTGLALQPEDCVGICMPRGVWTAAAVLGILKAGGAYVPLDISYPPERLRYMVEDSGINVVLVAEAGTLDRLGIYTAQEVVLQPAALAAAPAREPEAAVSADQLAYVLYTSGSTGLPKGVELEHRNTVAFLAWCRAEFADAGFDLALAVTSLNFDLSVFEFLYPLLAGKTIRVLESGLWLADYLPTVRGTRLMLNTVPSVVEMLLRTNVPLGSVTVLNMAGEPIGNYVRQRLPYGQMQVRNLYGPTEDTTYSTGFRLTGPGGAGKIGTPKHGSQAYVLGPQGLLQPVGVPGEICLSGAGLARGYRNRPELTQSRFVAHPFRPGQRLYRTGDWGYWGEDGQLVCTGRIDNQVKLRGYRVELGEIERKMEAAGATQAAALVVGEGGAQRLVGFYQAPGLTADDLAAYLQACLPAWMVPGQLVSLEAFPQTLNGKMDRRQLLRLLPAAEGAPAEAETWSPTESRLKPLWEAELNATDVKRTDNFFGLGGHSLKATQLLARIREAWGRDVPLKTIFRYPTLAGLAGALDALPAEANPAAPGTAPVPVRPADGRYPLSTIQEQLWVAHQLEGEGRSYHMPFGATLTGHLDAAAFGRAWDALVARHESLRTVFRPGESEVYQQVLPPDQLGFACRVHDLQGVPDAGAVAAEALRALVDEPFDLQTGPLLRVAVWQTGAATYQLGIVFHHLVCDGWSLGVVMREIFELYNGYCAGREPALAPLPLQYGDYAHWERGQPGTPAWEESRQYWLGQLGGELPVPALPAAGPRRLARRAKASAVERTLSPHLTAGLEAFARQQNVSLYSLLLAGLHTLLYRYTRQTDQVIGCAGAGRQEGPWQEQVGLYVNTLALRQRLDGADSFETLLGRVQQTVTGAYLHQGFGFGALVEALGLRPEPGRWPLFDLFFTLQEAGWDVLGHRHALAGLQLTRAAEPDTMPKYDLNITVSAAHPDRTIRARFDTGLFTHAQVERLLLHYEHLLAAVLAAPHTSLDGIDYLPAAEKAQLLAWGNPRESAPSAETIPSLFARQVTKTPDAVALLSETSTWTYAEVDAWSDRVAAALRARYAVGVGEKVGLLTGRSPWAVVGILGILKAGGAYVPLESTHPEARLAFMLGDSDVRVLLADDDTAAQAARLFGGAVVNVQAVPDLAGDRPAPAAIGPADLAYVMYTSGSTGNPKGVLVEHRGVVRLVHGTDFVTFGPDDRLLMTGALSFDATTFEIWGMLLNGGQLCIVANDRLLDTFLLQQTMMCWNVNMLWMTAAWFDQVADADPFVFDGLSWLLVGGDTLSPSHIAKVRAQFPHLKLINGYGPTENTTFSLCHRIDAAGAGSIPIGKPIAGSSAYVLDANRQLVPVGVEGEIYVGGAGLARGYQHQPDLTREKFIAHPFEPGGRLYRTGDLGRWLPDGTVEYLGRADDQVKIRGYRVETGEIEAALMGHPDVRQVAVLVETTAAGKHLEAYYVSENPLGEGDLRPFLQRSLPAHFLPDRFAWVARMPLTPNGKTDRAALRGLRPEPAAEPAPATEPVVVTALERALLDIWEGVLDRPLSNPEDNFFDVGGHSLRATKLVMQLRRQLGVSLPLAKIFECPTVRGLAREISPALEPADQTDQLLEEIII